MPDPMNRGSLSGDQLWRALGCVVVLVVIILAEALFAGCLS